MDSFYSTGTIIEVKLEGLQAFVLAQFLSICWWKIHTACMSRSNLARIKHDCLLWNQHRL